MRFSKYEGIGNDFVIVDAGDLNSPMNRERAMRICDRHRGVGADGVIVSDQTATGPSMRVYNSDGSIPEMCGNGVRCVALHLQRKGMFSSSSLTLHTDAGPHEILALQDKPQWFQVQMRAADFAPKKVPLRAQTPWVDHSYAVGGQTLRLTAVSMGNPHVVTFDNVGAERVSLAPSLAQDPVFPEGVNVGFGEIVGKQAMRLHVFERGVGWTLACGTGACAAAVAACRTQRLSAAEPIEVILPGGTLQITIEHIEQPVLMAGPAGFVYSGEVEM